MTSRRSFLKGIFGGLFGVGFIPPQQQIEDLGPDPPDFNLGLTGFEHGWYRLKLEGDHYLIPGVLAAVSGGSLVITKSLSPGKLSVFSSHYWEQLVEHVRRYKGPCEQRTAATRLFVAPATKIELQEKRITLPDLLKTHAGFSNSNLLVAFDGDKGLLHSDD